jgi:hypothetical protein
VDCGSYVCPAPAAGGEEGGVLVAQMATHGALGRKIEIRTDRVHGP